MSYADRLKAQLSPKGPTQRTDKTDKTPLVSPVGSSPDPFSRREQATPAEPSRRAADAQAGLIWTGIRRLWTKYGYVPAYPEFGEAMETALCNPDAAMALLRAEGAL